MRTIVIDQPGGLDVMRLGELPDPVAGPGELLLRVGATALNRMDLLQRRRRYPVPAGAPEAHRYLESNANVGMIVLRVPWP